MGTALTSPCKGEGVKVINKSVTTTRVLGRRFEDTKMTSENRLEFGRGGRSPKEEWKKQTKVWKEGDRTIEGKGVRTLLVVETS